MTLAKMTPKITPSINEDRTISGLVVGVPRPMHKAALLTLHLPPGLGQGGVSGRYFLVRCGAQTATERLEQWSLYLRRPLFVALKRGGAEDSQQQARDYTYDTWQVIIPLNDDAGNQWLLRRSAGESLNLIGPLGEGFAVSAACRNLLLLADAQRAPALLGLIDPMLDRGGKVTLLLRATSAEAESLFPLLPIPVEVQLAASAEQWTQQLNHTLRWADQACVALPNEEYNGLAAAIRQQRFRLETGFAQLLMEATYACGVGACLACVIPTPGGGYTRACVHGPVMELTRVVR